jgi:hypothetical protein
MSCEQQKTEMDNVLDKQWQHKMEVTSLEVSKVTGNWKNG